MFRLMKEECVDGREESVGWSSRHASISDQWGGEEQPGQWRKPRADSVSSWPWQVHTWVTPPSLSVYLNPLPQSCSSEADHWSESVLPCRGLPRNGNPGLHRERHQPPQCTVWPTFGTPPLLCIQLTDVYLGQQKLKGRYWSVIIALSVVMRPIQPRWPLGSFGVLRTAPGRNDCRKSYFTAVLYWSLCLLPSSSISVLFS